MTPIFTTALGALYEGDCIEFLAQLAPETVDLAFADPPFNLNKTYKSGCNDGLAESEYLQWCRAWCDQLIRVLKPGGSLFLWNLPKWNLPLGAYVGEKLDFRHWIAVDIKYSLPIKSRLYPSHYSLLYFTKGKPAIFHPDRTPVPCCPECGKELKDYGGYKDKMNPEGVNLADVWTDIPPVRHAKYKKREANALDLKLMDRIISMASDPGSVVLDPFGGSGTTPIAAEILGRKWITCELHCEDILARFAEIAADRAHMREIHGKKNILFTTDVIRLRERLGNPLSPKYRILGRAEQGSLL